MQTMKKCPQIEPNAFGFCFHCRRYLFSKCLLCLCTSSMQLLSPKVASLVKKREFHCEYVHFSNMMDSIYHFLHFDVHIHVKEKISRGFVMGECSTSAYSINSKCQSRQLAPFSRAAPNVLVIPKRKYTEQMNNEQWIRYFIFLRVVASFQNYVCPARTTLYLV